MFIDSRGNRRGWNMEEHEECEEYEEHVEYAHKQIRYNGQSVTPAATYNPHMRKV
jgi:hypothetical protein